MKNTLALGTASTMDVVSEHSYSQIERPEANLPKQTAAVRAILAANGGDKPIWHTEQGVGGDDDGYMAPSLCEADVAALYTRNLVTLRALGIGKYFWFSAQTSPTYGWAVFYENYIPRPRLAALNACASFLEGAAYRRSFAPGKHAFVHLFEGDGPVCVAWNLNAPARLLLPRSVESLRAFDLMGNEVPVAAGHHGIEVSLPAERPTYLRCRGGDRAMLEEALAAATMIDLDAVTVTARPAATRSTGCPGVQVTLTGRSRTAQDGVVEVLPSAAAAPAEWPAPRHFHSLACGESQSLHFVLPANATAREVRVRVGDRDIQELHAACTGD